MFGLPTAVNLATGNSFYAGVRAGLQIAPPVPGLEDPLNFGSIGMELTGERETNSVGNTDTSKMSFAGTFSYEAEGVGMLVTMAASAGASALKAKGMLSGSVHGQATIKRSQEVAITKSIGGLIEEYTLTDTVSCDLFGIKEANLAQISEMAVNMALKGKNDAADLNFSARLDVITHGDTELKQQVLDLLSRAEVGQNIEIVRTLPEDTLFEINGLLNPINEKGVPKSDEVLKADQKKAEKRVNDPNAYVITAFSLTNVEREVDNSRINVVKDTETMATGVVDRTHIATGLQTTKDTVVIPIR